MIGFDKRSEIGVKTAERLGSGPFVLHGLSADYLFATVQTLSKPENYRQFSPDYFEYIVIDEVHRSGAQSYQRLIDYFHPRFLLGMTCLGRLPAIDELGTVYLYLIVSLVASEARLGDLLSAPLWIVFGVSVLSFHALCMALLSKWFHWDLGIVATASMANIGGPASASLVASAYDPHYAAVAVLMGILGSALGNFLGLAMATLRIVNNIIL